MFELGDKVQVANNAITFIVVGVDPVLEIYDLKMQDANVVISVHKDVLKELK